MKKTVLFAILAFSAVFPLTAKTRPVTFSFGLGTAIPFYGTEESKDYAGKLDSNKRFVIATYALLNLNLTENAAIFSGAEFLADFNWENPEYANHLHVDFPFGLKLSPNLAGFAFGTAYLLGFRGDFYKIEGDGKLNTATAWGNGFKLFAEYDFSYHGVKFMPTIGLSWSILPRGSYEYDSQLSLYLGLHL